MNESRSPHDMMSHLGAGRRIGYIVAIIFSLVLLYVFNHLYEWGIPFLTEDYYKCLFYIHLSIYATIAIHAVFLFYDSHWFRHLLKAAANVFSALSVVMIYVIFPFSFASASTTRLVKVIVLIIMILSLISILVELVKAVKQLRTVSED
jgi:hypothetical protein